MKYFSQATHWYHLIHFLQTHFHFTLLLVALKSLAFIWNPKIEPLQHNKSINRLYHSDYEKTDCRLYLYTVT
jgi:isoprenylcysteine carboxyl methyltransferase (ICMT) family protein YpbQ